MCQKKGLHCIYSYQLRNDTSKKNVHLFEEFLMNTFVHYCLGFYFESSKTILLFHQKYV